VRAIEIIIFKIYIPEPATTTMKNPTIIGAIININLL
jgi:hypothetical protein